MQGLRPGLHNSSEIQAEMEIAQVTWVLRKATETIDYQTYLHYEQCPQLEYLSVCGGGSGARPVNYKLLPGI